MLYHALVLVVTSVFSRSYKPFPVPTSAQLFWSSLNAPTFAHRFLKSPLSYSSFLLPKCCGINPFKLLPTIHPVLDGFYPNSDPQWVIGVYFSVLCMLLSYASFFLSSYFFVVILPPTFLIYFVVFHIFVNVNIFLPFLIFHLCVVPFCWVCWVPLTFDVILCWLNLFVAGVVFVLASCSWYLWVVSLPSLSVFS